VVHNHVSAVIFTVTCFSGTIEVRRRNSSEGSVPNFILLRN
jgi:hypothetical protein